MDRTRLEFEPGLWLDARRALWLANHSVLVVADLHLGYAWAHRQAGNLLPVHEDTLGRLRDLIADYAPRELVLLGDIVHRAVFSAALKTELTALLTQIGELTALRLILGNHDAYLERLLGQCALSATLERSLPVLPHLLLHGDEDDEQRATGQLRDVAARGGRVIMGHEHPAITLGDGIASSVRCPCFAISGELLVLPAFSSWAAGCDLRNGLELSAFARQTRFTRAVAVLAGKLLPLSYGVRQSSGALNWWPANP